MNIESTNREDQLFLQLRMATVQRLRAAARGDSGICMLLECVRQDCLAQLGGRERIGDQHILSAA